MTICRHLGVNFEEFVELIEEYVQYRYKKNREVWVPIWNIWASWVC